MWWEFRKAFHQRLVEIIKCKPRMNYFASQFVLLASVITDNWIYSCISLCQELRCSLHPVWDVFIPVGGILPYVTRLRLDGLYQYFNQEFNSPLEVLYHMNQLTVLPHRIIPCNFVLLPKSFSCQRFFILLFSPQLYWDIIDTCVNFRSTVWLFDKCVYCEIIAIIQLVNTCITLGNYHFIFSLGVENI